MRTNLLETVRSILFWALLLALVGTGAELLLLGHIQSPAQLIPVGLIAAGALILSWHAISGSSASIRAFQVLMILFVAAGLVGIALHFKGNIEVDAKKNPDSEGMELFRSAVTGDIPALAPGAMIQIGLVGLAFTWGYPRRGDENQG